MKKICLVLFIISSFCATAVFPEEVEINAEVMDINPELEFFVIDSGEDKGVELGDGLIVHRFSEKIAEAYIIEVRPAVSAAEILKIEEGKEIKEGDNAIIVKKTGAKKVAEKPGSRWTPLLAPGRDILPQEPSAVISPEPMEMETADIEHAPPITPEGTIFEINIDSKPEIVFSYTGIVLRENGYSVVSSSRLTGRLVATKPIELTLLKELWADSLAAIDHKVMASFEIKPGSDSTKLKVSPYREHIQKDKYIKRAVPPGSKYHKELANIAYIIKKRSEY